MKELTDYQQMSKLNLLMKLTKLRLKTKADLTRQENLKVIFFSEKIIFSHTSKALSNSNNWKWHDTQTWYTV